MIALDNYSPFGKQIKVFLYFLSVLLLKNLHNKISKHGKKNHLIIPNCALSLKINVKHNATPHFAYLISS